MKSLISKLLLVAIFNLLCINSHAVRPRYYLTIDVNNILILKGKMYIGIYNNEKDFKDKKYYTGMVTNVKSKTIRIVFRLPKGTYSVQMFQDTNDDETMNSLFGVPLEPYGVSRNAKGFPSFSNTRFKLDKNKKINIKLKN